MSDLRFCAECACGYEWQPGWGALCGGCRRAEILERERDVALDRITALEAELDEERQAVEVARSWIANVDMARGVRVALLDGRGDNVRVHYLAPGEPGVDGDLTGVFFAGFRLDWEPEQGWGTREEA